MQTFSRQVQELIDTLGYDTETAITIVASGGYMTATSLNVPDYHDNHLSPGVYAITY